ncbi:MAG TPA: cell wall-binding repeat-containing protein, partial [Acidimicrobiales bacterium]|nr:cell wall-binding repeat-containing protein [Acidimicrobiales bacterium]
SLSDPTDRSNQPRLQRVASADPLFDPIGAVDRVDTGAAPIVVTESARTGARRLSASARTALADLAGGGCRTAREAIIVGGTMAVPPQVGAELVQLGYEEVFRVAGDDRYDTAARIAVSLGTEAVPSGASCTDPVVGDGATSMGFYANAAIEFRPDAGSCHVLSRTVALAEGETGADALAAGWWTSYWQVPVLLVAGDGTLPPPTRAALRAMEVDTLVVLGGTGRIPERTVDEAKALASAVAGRFAGRDRYETSVRMAQVFGGWHATGDPGDAVGDRVCLAASSGTAGWPDALAAGPFCGRLAATARQSPSRAAPPVELTTAATEARAPAHQAVPVLLVPIGEEPTAAVADLLAGAFPPDGRWCTGGDASSCRIPGFAVAFGGRAVLDPDALATVSSLLAGDDDVHRSTSPRLDSDVFRTGLVLAPLYEPTGNGPEQVCFDEGALRDLRWLAAYTDAAHTKLRASTDLLGAALYLSSRSSPMCMGVDAIDTDLRLVGSAVDGNATPSVTARARTVRADLSGAVVTRVVDRTGDPGPSTVPGSATTWRFSTDAPGVTVLEGAQRWEADSAMLELVLIREDEPGRARFVGEALLQGADVRSLAVQVRGVAALVGGRWELAGRAEADDTGSGGFRGVVSPHDDAEDDRDSASWRLDLHGA